MPSLFSTQLNQKRMMPQNIQCEIEDASLIGAKPERKATEGDNGKHADYMYPGHIFSCALTDGKVRRFSSGGGDVVAGAQFYSVEQSPGESLAFFNLDSSNIHGKRPCKF